MTDLKNQIAAAIAQNEILEQNIPSTDIGRFITKYARIHPEKIALNVFDDGEEITYLELETQTNKIGNAILSLDIEKGDRAICMLPNRIEYPLIWLALAKTGAVHVPANTRYTPDEITFIINNATPKIAFVDSQFLEVFKQAVTKSDHTEIRIIPLGGNDISVNNQFDALVNAASEQSCQNESLLPADMMNIQYTSGTTGLPKGCILSHDYWLLLAHVTAAWDHKKPNRLLTAQPFFYMDPQWQLLKSILLGATLFMAPGLSASRFISWVKKYQIEWCQFPLLMTRQPVQNDDHKTKLKQVATFGWSSKTCQGFRNRFGVLAREGFGMTEIGLGCWVKAEIETLYDSGSVGIAGPCRELSIRGEDGIEVTNGDIGELWVRGRGLFNGYWNNPKATANAITPDGWFRTGDLFRHDENGCYFLVGRLKDMIRRSQENISAREVEMVINELDAVEDSAAVAVPDELRGEEVKIYIQLKSGLTQVDLPVEIIIEHASQKLAAFKRPRYIAFMDKLPRTPSNKIEKPTLIANSTDLRIGTFDTKLETWW